MRIWYIVLFSFIMCIEAYAVQWPLRSVDRLLSTYGQFNENTLGNVAGYHFHEGLEIVAPGGTEMYDIGTRYRRLSAAEDDDMAVFLIFSSSVFRSEEIQ